MLQETAATMATPTCCASTPMALAKWPVRISYEASEREDGRETHGR